MGEIAAGEMVLLEALRYLECSTVVGAPLFHHHVCGKWHTRAHLKKTHFVDFSKTENKKYKRNTNANLHMRPGGWTGGQQRPGLRHFPGSNLYRQVEDISAFFSAKHCSVFFFCGKGGGTQEIEYAQSRRQKQS